MSTRFFDKIFTGTFPNVVCLLGLVFCGWCFWPKPIDFPIYEQQKEEVAQALEAHLQLVQEIDGLYKYRSAIIDHVSQLIRVLRHNDITFYEARTLGLVAYVNPAFPNSVFVSSDFDWGLAARTNGIIANEISHIAFDALDLPDGQDFSDVPVSQLPYYSDWFDWIVLNRDRPANVLKFLER